MREYGFFGCVMYLAYNLMREDERIANRSAERYGEYRY